MSTSIPRVALVGVSGYAQHYRQMVWDGHDAGRLSAIAVVIINRAQEGAVAREFERRGTTVYDTFDQMIESERGKLDLCLVPTGIPWHARLTVAALESGMNVLVEKPLAGSVADVRGIRAAEETSGRFVAVGFQDIYGDAAGWLKERVLAGAIGRLRAVRFIGCWPRSRAYFGRNTWAGKLFADGAAVFDSPLNNAFSHHVNLALFVAGAAAQESAAARVIDAELLRAHAIESFDTAVVRAETSDGVRCWFGATHACDRALEPEIHFDGDNGTAIWRHARECVVAPRDGVPVRRALPDNADSRRHMFARVLARVHDGGITVCTSAMAACHTALIEAVHRAASIREINPELVRWQPSGDGAFPTPVVTDLVPAMQRAFVRGCTLSEAGFSASITKLS